jgi:excinuclease ABC subunit A
LSAEALKTFLEGIALTGPKSIVAAPILTELYGRIETLISLGLQTLPLNRNSSSLSGGELQRLRLAAAIGSPLSGVLYLFDEPSAGLHPTDNALVLDQIQTLKNNGNTVVVIEHDPETILAADHVIEIGPGGGSKGGQVLFNGSKDEFSSSQAYSQLFAVHEPSPHYVRASTNDAVLTISGSSRNISSLTTTIPLQSLVVIAGVSGAGKSSLVYDILYNTITQGSEPTPKQSWKSPHGTVSSSLPIDKVLDVDQSPIGSTSRSVPASYLKIWDEIRKLFAATIEAKSAGLDASFFSFNTGKGRCPECKGLGTIKLQMNFLPDSSIICEACNGDRFSDKCHHITYRGMTVSQVLSLTFEDALSLFQAHRKIHKTLSIACDLGLGYLSLGQDSSTLSGGEAQRIKLVQELSSRSSGHNLYILDEPSTGLHRSDVGRLIKVLNRLVEQGNSIIVIEHDLDILQAAQHIIELGPGSGPQGGTIIFEGPPQSLKKAKTPWGRELGRRMAAISATV